MEAPQTLTQAGLRLDFLTFEMRSIIDRTVRCPKLHEIVQYCVPRRLLGFFCIWGQRENKGLMRLDIVIDYEEHDRQITLTGDGLPDGVAGRYSAGGQSPEADPPRGNGQLSCPHVSKAIDVFVKAARDRGLQLGWGIRFAERTEELWKQFNLVGNTEFKDRTAGACPAGTTHSVLPEVKIWASVAPGLTDGADVAPRGQE